MIIRFLLGLMLAIPLHGARADDALRRAVAQDYEAHLGELFRHFHRYPEPSVRYDVCSHIFGTW